MGGKSFSLLSEAIWDFCEKFLHFIKEIVRIQKFRKAVKYYEISYLSV